MKVDMSNVTLVTVDMSCHELTGLAIEDCKEHAVFGDIKVFTNTRDMLHGEYVEGLSTANYFDFSLYKLPYMINTKHLLWIHWDSWIIDPGMWRKEFLDYDYIGAPWWYRDGMNVGNSGFCIRSVNLMRYIAEHKDQYAFSLKSAEDHNLCRVYRQRLTEAGFTWAPEATAADFAFERARASLSSRHFGFHGVFNWPFVLPPNRLATRLDMARKNKYISSSGQLGEVDNLFAAMWRKLNIGHNIYRSEDTGVRNGTTD